MRSLSERIIDWSESGSLADRLAEWASDATAESDLKKDESLRRRSSLRIGGSARWWIEIGDVEDLVDLLAKIAGDRTHCIGLGSNVLFPDDGLDEPVLRFVGDLAEWTINDDETGRRATVDVAAGTINAHLVRGLLAEGWVGAEFLTLIPGTFGGAVALNAGTRDKELRQILRFARVAVPDEEARKWRIERLSPAQLQMGYRRCELPDGAIVVGGRIEVGRGDVDAARARMDADKERRDRTQPYRLASVGSTFANPDGDYAGRLIDEVGLKGHRVGGARISELHANFFINEDDATTDDFLRLMALARRRVRDRFDIELRPEVRFVGFDGEQRLRELERSLEVEEFDV